MNAARKVVQLPGRIDAFDWLRIVLFAMVVLIHCVQMYGELYRTAGSVGIEAVSDGGAYTLSFVTRWAMSMFFALAGASTFLVLCRKSSHKFVEDRFRRLLVPFMIGYAMMVPIQAYFEMSSNGQFHGTLIDFYPFFLSNIIFGGKAYWLVSNIHHLWFILYLLGYSLITLPLCQYLRSERGQGWLERLAAICEKPGGLLVLVMPVVVVQIALRGIFPEYCSVTDAICWMLYYMTGYVLFASSRLGLAIRQQGKVALGLAVAGSLALIVLWRLGWLHTWIYTPDYSLSNLLVQALTSITLWCWLVVVLVYSDRCLKGSCAFLKYGSKASFSWYLVHFPIVLIVAYYMLPLHLNVVVSFLLLSVGSFVLTLVVAELQMRMQNTRIKVLLYVEPVQQPAPRSGTLAA